MRLVLAIAVSMAAATAAHARGLECEQVDQKEFDKELARSLAMKDAVATTVDGMRRLESLTEEDGGEKITRVVSLHTPPGDARPPMLIRRVLIEDDRFYIEVNKAWTIGGPEAECLALLRALIAEEGGFGAGQSATMTSR